jgi:hypothetical protein
MKKLVLVAALTALTTGCAMTGQSRTGKAVLVGSTDVITLCQVAYHGETTEERTYAYQELVYRGENPKSNECERHAAQVTAFGDAVPRLVGDVEFLERVKNIPADTVEPRDQWGEEIDLFDLIKKL